MPPAAQGFGKSAFLCGMENEARCLTAAGIRNPIALSGAQPERAVDCARELLAAGAESLISFGLAGGLDPRLGPGAVIVADRIVAWPQALPASSPRAAMQGIGSILRGDGVEVPPPEEKLTVNTQFACDSEMSAQLSGVLGEKIWRGAIVGVDQAVTRPADKLGLYAATTGLACDMESHVVAEIAQAAGVPFVALRIVSDPSNRAIPQSALAGITPEGGVSPRRVLAGLAVRPWELFEIFSLALDARSGFAALRRVARRSAPLFGAVG
jgi:adenosylhomocysteine nucleosidase